MIHLINFADEKYREFQRISSRMALKHGVEKVWEFSPEDIDVIFKQKFQNIFKYKRGYGLWLWKPYFINQVLSQVDENDIIIYCDTGVTIYSNIAPLLELINDNNNGMLFFELPLFEKEWTKREVMEQMGYSDNGTNHQIDASFFILKVNDFSKKFIKKWFLYCQDERLLSSESFSATPNSINFQNHREDQSILSILVHMNGLPIFRDPSDYGEFPYQYKNPKWSWERKRYANSSYKTITLHNRAVNFYKYRRKYIIKHFLSKIGLSCFFNKD